MKRFGLIGYPLGHSFSRTFFSEKFLRENIDAEYSNFEIPDIELLPEIITGTPELTGLNVTIPYKEKIIRWLNYLDPVAEETGAVNTVRIHRQGSDTMLEGFNTDVRGFRDSLIPMLKTSPGAALILGTGGASKAVKYVLKKLGIEYLEVSRTIKGNGIISYNDITKDLLERHKIIINTTPLGTWPNVDDCPDLPYAFLNTENILYDLVYNPPETRFLAYGKEKGAIIKNGYEMLEIQALESYRIWTEY